MTEKEGIKIILSEKNEQKVGENKHEKDTN